MRETTLEEKTRQDEARVAAIKERQIRLGHVPAPEETDEEEPEAEPQAEPESEEPKAKAPAKKKSE